MKIAPLRDYQRRDYAQLQDALKRHQRVLVSAPTGYGKTRVAGELALDARKKGERVLFLAPWRELIPQTIARFNELGISSVGVMMSGYEPDPSAAVVVGSVETVRRWAPHYPELQDFDYIVADEAHRYGTDLRKEMLAQWEDAALIGFTATPFRADRGGLGDMFEFLVQATMLQELIDKNYLVVPVFYSVDPSTLQSFRVAPGSMHVPKKFGNKPKRPQMVGDVIKDWQAMGKGKTLCFANSVQESKDYAAKFRAIGLKAEHVDASTPDGERDAILERFAKGATQIVCNHGVLCEGYDLPNIETVILKRTGSLMTYLQMIGRGLRASEGKTECIVLDPAGNVFRFGFPQDYRTYSLSGAPREQPIQMGLFDADELDAGNPLGRVDNPSISIERLGPVHAVGTLERVDKLPDDPTAVMKRLEAQAESSGFGMPWAIAEFRRQFDGHLPSGAHYRKDAEAYYRRQAKAAGLPVKWAKERTQALFSR